MSKELRISIVAHVGDDLWEQAAQLTTIKPALDRLTEDLARAEVNASVEVSVVQPKPRLAPVLPLIGDKQA